MKALGVEWELVARRQRKMTKSMRMEMKEVDPMERFKVEKKAETKS